MSRLLSNLRISLRSLAKQPTLAGISILAFGLGIGLTTTMYSIVHGALKDLPFEKADRLMHLERNNLAQDINSMEVTLHDYLDWQKAQTTFTGLAAYYQGTMNLSGDGDPPERYSGAFITANGFGLLGVTPALGRLFVTGEDQPGAEPVVILSWKLWQKRYAGDPAIIGRALRVNGATRTVVGVMPDGFLFPIREQIWLPLGLDPVALKRGAGETLEVYGRLKDGVGIDQARAEMAAIAQQLASAYPETNKGVGSVIKPFTEEFVGEEPTLLLYVMLGAVFGVLLIACANVANLLLARAIQRSREVAVRSALGADRRHAIAQWVTEAAILAGAGALLGLGIAAVGVSAFSRAIAPTEPPFWIDIRINLPVLLFVAAITAAASLLAGLVPALKASGSKVTEVLKDEGRGTTGLRIGRLTRGLVVAEIALSAALLVLTGLMIKSVVQLKKADFGVEGDKVYTARIALFPAKYPDVASRRAFLEQVEQGLASLPGVQASGLGSGIPVYGGDGSNFRLEGADYPSESDLPWARKASITTGYFDAFGVRTTAGRAFTSEDRTASLPVAIVNQPFVARHFKEGSPLGKRIGVEGPGGEIVWRTIVGVVPNLYMDGPDNDDPEAFYLPLAQDDAAFVSLVVAGAGDPHQFAKPIQTMVSGLDADLPTYFNRTFAEVVRQQTWFYSVFGTLFMVFGGAALLLAAIGLYGVMAFSVGQRTQEVGIRMAMGAESGSVLQLIFRQGARQILLGLAIGLAFAPLLSRALRMVLFNVSPFDPTIFLAIVAVLSLTGAAACLVPAQRAARVSPMVALRG